MAFKDDHAPSTVTKLLMVFAILLGTLIPALLMTERGDALAELLDLDRLQGNRYRQLLIVSCSLVYLIRFATAMFVFVQRKIGWFEGGLVSILFFMLFYLFNSSAATHDEPIGTMAIMGAVLYVVGSHVNSLADYQRFVWKKKGANQGRLFTDGLFKYSMHINYFGDSLVYIGMAAITREFVCVLVATGIVLNFVFLQIPMLDNHLSKKYADEFGEYAARTKRFVPFLY